MPVKYERQNKLLRMLGSVLEHILFRREMDRELVRGL